MKSLEYSTKKLLIDISRICFWYRKNFYSFLDSCKIPKTFYSHLWKDIYKQDIMCIVFEAIERQQKWDLLDNIISNIYKLKVTNSDGLPDLKRATEILQEFRNHIWNDPIEKEIQKRNSAQSRIEYEKSIEDNKSRKDKIEKLKNRFIEIQKNIGTQRAWYELEILFFDLLTLEWFECHPPYRTDHEQIDGSFKYEKFDYIVEIKWTTQQAGQNEFSIFDWKIRGKWQSTRGFFFSINWFIEASIQKYSWDSPRIVCMDWSDLYFCLENRAIFHDIIQHKVDALVRKWQIYCKPNF